MHDIAAKLFIALEWIELLNGDLLHGTSMRYETVHGVLHFFVNFNMPVLFSEPEIDPMETVDTTITPKG